jgi:hypothetical protein
VNDKRKEREHKNRQEKTRKEKRRKRKQDKKKRSTVSTYLLGERTGLIPHPCGNCRWKKPRKISNPYPQHSTEKLKLCAKK